jgi:predicted dienelactone hydrolase
MFNNRFNWLVLFAMIFLMAKSRAQQTLRPIPDPIAPPYAPDRKLLPTDFLRFDWHDASRNRDVPVKIYYPTNGAGPFPVIVFSHGLGGTREGYEYLARQWAANGFVSVHVQHIGSDDSAWRGQGQPMQSMRQAANLQNSLNRPKDVQFVVDQLTDINKNDPKLQGKLDLTNLGMAGHSFGAQTSMLIAGQKLGGALMGQKLGANLADPRFKAVIAMSDGAPMNHNNLDDVYAAVQIPTFYMTGTKDDSPIGDTKASERRIPFDHTHAKPTYLLVLTDGDHMVFSGRLAQPRPTDEPQQKLIRIASTAFFDAYLKNDANAKKWLDENGFKQLLGEQGTFEEK